MKKSSFLVCIVVGFAFLSFKTAAPAAGSAETNNFFPDLKKQQEQLMLENSIADLQLRKELAGLAARKQKLELENGLALQKFQADAAAMQVEIDTLGQQTELLNKRYARKEAERKAQFNQELAEDREKLERIRLTNDLAAAEISAKTRDMSQREQEFRVRTAEFQAQRLEFEMQLAKLNSELDLRAKRDQWKNRVDHDVAYTREPFENGRLTISDRRIPLNGLITPDTADYVAERIDYFNNQNSEFPIFIVIDRSPGGSVMAGWEILKAMEGSAAPVYVVVKSYAASMAANILTQAKKSFAYPNAIIIHHQILNESSGNLTAHKEQLKDLEESWKRLAQPVASKMGISLDEFIKRMYQNRSSGDWQEFGDSARRLKWVDEIAQTVREQSFDKNPDAGSGPSTRNQSKPALEERVDALGHRHLILPRLEPVDCYYLYNPDNYYQMAP